MAEQPPRLEDIFPRSLDEIMAVMMEHGMTRLEATRAIIDPSRIPANVREVLKQVGHV